MIVPERLAKLEERVAREIDAGLLPAAQFAVGLEGEIVAEGTLGDATDDTRFVLFSATKALVASTVWTCLGEGSIKLESKVADMIPEFATNGKEDITVEQVMLHTSGFPRNPWGAEMATSAGRRERFAKWKTNWAPGTAYEYHPTAAHWVLAELIEVATGENFLDVIEERVTKPLGLPRVLGLAPDQQDNIAELQLVGEPMTPDELEAILGVREIPVGEVTPDALLSFNEADRRELGVPGGGGVATAATYATFYQGLLHNGPAVDGTAIWHHDVLTDAKTNVRNHFGDPIFNTPANRTVGLVIAGDDDKASLRGFGKTQSPGTFGHNGAGGQIAWADPASGLSFVYLTNGMDQHLVREGRRGVALSSIAAELDQAHLSAAMRIGDIELIPLSDGMCKLPQQFYIGLDFETHPELLADDGRVHIPIGCYLMRTGDVTVLLDAGLGPETQVSWAKGGDLARELASHGVTPADIDIVVASHLHIDHIGGLAVDGEPFFPNATVRYGHADWDEFVTNATAEDHTRYVMEALADAGRLEPIDGDMVSLAPGLTARATPGHTLGHYCLVVSSRDERAFLLGDAVECPLQLEEPDFYAMSDVDPKMAARTRELLWRELEGTDAMVGAAHFQGLEFGRGLRGTGTRYRFLGS